MLEYFVKMKRTPDTTVSRYEYYVISKVTCGVE